MGDKAVELLEGELGVKLKAELPPKTVRLRKADAQSSKKKKEGSPVNPRQALKKSKGKLASNGNSNNDGNPLEWISLNRCILVAILMIGIGTGVNSLNETWETFWEAQNAELPPEELPLEETNITEGDIVAEIENSLWSSLFWWRRVQDDCEGDEDCDSYDDYDYDYDVDAADYYGLETADEDDDADNDDETDDDPDEDAEDNDTVADDDDSVDGEDEDSDRNDDDDSPGKSRKKRDDYTLQRWRKLSLGLERGETDGKREKEIFTRQRHRDEDEDEDEDEEERPRKKRQREEREHRRG